MQEPAGSPYWGDRRLTGSPDDIVRRARVRMIRIVWLGALAAVAATSLMVVHQRTRPDADGPDPRETRRIDRQLDREGNSAGFVQSSGLDAARRDVEQTVQDILEDARAARRERDVRKAKKRLAGLERLYGPASVRNWLGGPDKLAKVHRELDELENDLGSPDSDGESSSGPE